MYSLRKHRGQASVELLVAIPLTAVVLLAAWQMVLTGHTWWKVQEAARLTARVHYAATQRGDAAAGLSRGRELASALLGSSPPRSRRVDVSKSGVVTVSARAPLIEPFRSALGMYGGPRLSASSRMRP